MSEIFEKLHAFHGVKNLDLFIPSPLCDILTFVMLVVYVICVCVLIYAFIRPYFG